MSVKLSALIMMACAGLAASELTVKNAADLKGVKGEISDAGAGIRIAGKYQVTSKAKLAVDPAKSYEVSFRLRAGQNAKTPGNYYIGLVCYDAAGKEITVQSVTAFQDTITELAAPAKRGDTVLKVKDASKWKLQYAHIAFNARKDLSDLPNYDISPLVTKIEKKGQVWELTLKSPVMKDYPAGTAVRRHADSNTYRYLCANQVPGKEWKDFKFTVTGIAKTDSNNYAGKFRAGTKSVQFVLFPGSLRICDLEIANIKMVEKAAPQAKK